MEYLSAINVSFTSSSEQLAEVLIAVNVSAFTVRQVDFVIEIERGYYAKPSYQRQIQLWS
jgi:hypothetical protein